MANKGKMWTQEHDKKLMEYPNYSDLYFSQIMLRSENAIKFRRSHLAAKMYIQNSTTPLEEYVGLMGADMQHAENVVEQWKTRHDPLTLCIPTNRKRKANGIEKSNGIEKIDTQTQKSFYSLSIDEKISLICKTIHEEEGRLWNLWNDPDLTPYLIQYYPGFDAYARYISQNNDA